MNSTYVPIYNVTKRWGRGLLKLIFLITILNLPKFLNLNGGIILGEPDEFTHAEIVANFSKSFWPQFSGGPWYYNLPLYPWLGYLASFVFKNQFLALRGVSCFFSLILALAIFFYVGHKYKVVLSASEGSSPGSGILRPSLLATHGVAATRSGLRMTRGELAGFAAALLWTLCPFAIYYSRIGVIEMTVTTLCFLFLFTLDYALETRRKKWALLSGLFLAMAILTKYTALIFVFVLLIHFVVLSLKQTLKGAGTGTIKLDIIPTIPLFVTAAIFLPTAFIFYHHDPYLYKVHTLVNLVSWEKFTGARVWVGENRLPPLIWPFVERMRWWLSWPVLVLAVVGVGSCLVSFWRERQRPIESRPKAAFIRSLCSLDPIATLQDDKAFLLVSFLLASFFILRRLPFYPRYFLPLVPFIVIFAGVGFEALVRLTSCHPELVSGSPSPRFRNKFGMTTTLLLLISTIFILSTSITALQATNHNLIENTGQYIKSQTKEENLWLFSNYWPHFFGKAAGTSKATWLAESKDEIQAFIPDEERIASEILKEEGGFVVLEELYSEALISPNKYREEARQWLLENYEPFRTILDPSPNFPHSRLNENRVKVFVME